MKRKLSFLLDICGLSYVFFKLSLLLYGRKHIRVVNYHETDKKFLSRFEQQLQFYSRYYESVSAQDFQSFFQKPVWHKKKPGLIISFDDGLRCNYDNALPLLEKYGFTGWFCIPASFIDCTVTQQHSFAQENKIAKSEYYSDGRIAMDWSEVKELNNRNHVIVNHTSSHHRMKEEDTDKLLQEEIIASNILIKERTNFAPDIFCWVGGEEKYYTPKALRYIKSHYRFGFMTNTYPTFKSSDPYFIERTNIEANYPLHLVRFQLCGLMDLFYTAKRRKLRKKLKG